jgi:hypothetical protein
MGMGVSAGAVVAAGVLSGSVVAAVVGSTAGVVGVGVAADWQPRRRMKTAERARVRVRFGLRVTRVNVLFVTFCPCYKIFHSIFFVM